MRVSDIFLWHSLIILAVQHERVNCSANTRSGSRFLSTNANDKRNFHKTAIKMSRDSNNFLQLNRDSEVADSTTSPQVMGTHLFPTLSLPSLQSSIPSLYWNSSVSPVYSTNYYTMNQIASNTFNHLTRLIFNTGIVTYSHFQILLSHVRTQLFTCHMPIIMFDKLLNRLLVSFQ